MDNDDNKKNNLTELEELFSFNDIPKWKFEWFKITVRLSILWHDLHSDEFRHEWKVIKYRFLLWLYGFKPITIGYFFGEDTIVFKTNEEAKKAFEILERGSPIPETGIEDDSDLPPYRGLICAWWYGEEEFNNLISEYESYVEIYWKRN